MIEWATEQQAQVSQSLLQRVAAGNSDASIELIDRYGGLVWSLARRLSRSESDAEDAVQEIFTAVWTSAGRFDPGIASEATFIGTIARRRLIDRGRRFARQPRTTEISGSVEGELGDVTPQRRAEMSEEAGKALAVIESLRAEQQRVLRLSIYHGLTHEQIAETTGLPLGTIKTNIRRGLLAVRDALNVKSRSSIEVES